MPPIITLLNGLGLVMIHRIDLANGTSISDGVALRQLMWTRQAASSSPLPCSSCCATTGCCAATPLAGVVGFVLLLLPLMPVIDRRSTAPGSGSASARCPPAQRDRQDRALAIFFAGYPCRPWTPSSCRRSGARPTRSRARDLGPILIAWLASLAVQARARPRFLAAVLRPVRRDAVRRDRASTSWIAIASPCSSRRLRRVPDVAIVQTRVLLSDILQAPRP